ncbi:hypothetical protein KIN20_005935 [Parelaphostrongylus tenuis]|uniref:Uncharacterized protein n=1 Tax=Parelaphostrongylus tenuis TaxID=148309 RepID=A0AAD5QKL7_PARTN|nr:hypothetical protein KIN20_005935 [Parelaphostrongylus tenuis]
MVEATPDSLVCHGVANHQTLMVYILLILRKKDSVNRIPQEISEFHTMPYGGSNTGFPSSPSDRESSDYDEFHTMPYGGSNTGFLVRHRIANLQTMTSSLQCHMVEATPDSLVCHGVANHQTLMVYILLILRKKDSVNRIPQEISEFHTMPYGGSNTGFPSSPSDRESSDYDGIYFAHFAEKRLSELIPGICRVPHTTIWWE